MGLGHRWCFGSGCGVLFENSTGCLDGQRVGWLNGLVFWLGGLTGCFLTVFSLGLLAVVAGGSGIFRLGLLRRMLVLQVLVGEFDPGSGRTLAACFTHASRTERLLRECSSGERVSNTWVTCPHLWDNCWKRWLIPDRTRHCMMFGGKLLRLGRGSRPISWLVG